VRVRRGILVVVALAILPVGTAVVAVPLFWPRLPDPAVADRDDVFRWLVVRDLGKESADTRLVLVRRLEEEFSTEFDWQNAGKGLDEAQRRQLWKNVQLLIGPWLLDKTDGYYMLAVTERPAYLDRLIDTITVWQGIDSLRPKQTDTSDEQGGLIAALLDQTERWKQQATPHRRSQIDRFIVAVQARWLLRNL